MSVSLNMHGTKPQSSSRLRPIPRPTIREVYDASAHGRILLGM